MIEDLMAQPVPQLVDAFDDIQITAGQGARDEEHTDILFSTVSNTDNNRP